MPALTVLVLTKDEGENLPALVASLQGLDHELVVIDSGSQDDTLRISKEAGARVIEHEFATHSRQWAWALQNVPIRTPWVLGLDADQRLSPRLRDEIASVISSPPVADGYSMPRVVKFQGRWIRRGGARKRLLKMFRHPMGRVDADELVDHHFFVTGRVGRLSGELLEDNVKDRDLAAYVAKCMRYAALQAQAERTSASAPDSRARTWRRLPRYARAVGYFAYRYVLRLGFVEGRQGFLFHFLQALWYRVMVDAEIDRMAREAPEGAG